MSPVHDHNVALAKIAGREVRQFDVMRNGGVRGERALEKGDDALLELPCWGSVVTGLGHFPAAFPLGERHDGDENGGTRGRSEMAMPR